MTKEEEIREDIRKKYKDTYPNIIFTLCNRIERLKQEIEDAELEIGELKNYINDLERQIDDNI